MKNIRLKKPVGFVNILLSVVFAAVAFWLLAIDGEFYLQKIESLSIFLSCGDFFRENMLVPGGLLAWASAFLTQTFYHPVLGGAIYVVLLLALTALAVKAFRLSWRCFGALLAVPSMALLALLNMEYLIFSMKTPGYAFLLPLGLTAVLLVCWGWRSAGRKWWARLVGIVLIAWFGYCGLGFYGLLATAVCVAFEIRNIIGKSGGERWQSLLNALVGLVAIAVVPKIWFSQIGGRLIMENIYLVQLPRFYEGEESKWTPYYIIMCVTVLLPLLDTRRNISLKWSKRLTIVSVAVGVAAMASIFKYRYVDENFRCTLAIDRALLNCDWEKAAQYARNLEDEPTRLNVFLTDVALIRSGEAADKAFTYKIGSAKPNTPARELRVTHDAGSMMLTYHLGHINSAYRWAMEIKVEYGLRVEYLQFMAKCALLNKEYKLAEKYLDNISMTMFHKDWAEKYRAYIKNPKLMEQDPEMKHILPIITVDDKFVTENGQLEGYIWPDIAAQTCKTHEQIELGMISALVCRDIQDFAAHVPYYMQKHKGRIPTHFQEAIMMWLVVNDVKDYKRYQIDDEVAARCQEFMKMLTQYEKQSKQVQKDLIEPIFGDTYWYYFVLNTGLRII